MPPDKNNKPSLNLACVTGGVSHSYEVFNLPGDIAPLATKEADDDPALPSPDLAVARSESSVQVVPFQYSVLATKVVEYPPTIKPSV